MPPNISTTLRLAKTNSGSILSASRDNADCTNLITGALIGRTATPITILGQFKYTFGTPGANKILLSDADGDATWQAQSSIDHGSLGGLLDDDHTQYRLESEDHSHASAGLQAGQISHTVLTSIGVNSHAVIDTFMVTVTPDAIIFNGGGPIETTFSITIPAASTSNDGDNLLVRPGAAGPSGGAGGDLYLAGGGAGGGVSGAVYLGWDGSVASLGIYAKVNFYPGNQATRYISDDGTYTFISAGLKLGAALYPGNQTTHYITGNSTGIGIDIAPHAWGSGVSGLELKNAGAFFTTEVNSTYMASGGYYNGTNWINIGNVNFSAINLEAGIIKFATAPNSGSDGGTLTLSTVVTIFNSGGVNIGAPTGGDKGAGTLNATAVYDDNVLLTDWLFDLYYDGRVSDASRPYWNGQHLCSLGEASGITSAERRLPWMPTRANFEEERSLGGMVSRLWQGQEQQQIYIMELEQRVAQLEA